MSEDLKISQLNNLVRLTADDLFVVVNDPSGAAETVKTSRANATKRLIESTAKTANYSLTTNDEIILFDSSASSLSAYLPAASGSQGKCFTIKKIDSSSNSVTIDPNASETIDGSGTYFLSSQNDVVTIVCDDTNWRVISAKGSTEFTIDVNGEEPSGDKDQMNTSFTLNFIPSNGTLRLFYNGIIQQEGIGKDYTLSSNNITMAVAPYSDDSLVADYSHS